MTLDIILLILLFLSLLKGWRSGALVMLLSLAILIAAGWAAMIYGGQAGEMLKVGPVYARPVIGFLFVFLLLLLFGGIVKRWVRPRRGILRGLDAMVGAVLGLIRGGVILGIFLSLLAIVHLPPLRFTKGSRLYSILLSSTSIIHVGRPLQIHRERIPNSSDPVNKV